MTVIQVSSELPYSASFQARHEIKSFRVISLQRDLAMVNNTTKSSNLRLSHVHFYLGGGVPPPLSCVIMLLYLTLERMSKV